MKKLFFHAFNRSDPDRTQTCDLQNRNLTFYSLNYGAKCVAKVRNICSFAKRSYEKSVIYWK